MATSGRWQFTYIFQFRKPEILPQEFVGLDIRGKDMEVGMIYPATRSYCPVAQAVLK